MFVDLKNLVEHWHDIAEETECEDISMAYTEDARDAQNVLDFLDHGNTEGAMFALNRMDTEPREAVVMAIYADTDKQYVYNLGWEI